MTALHSSNLQQVARGLFTINRLLCAQSSFPDQCFHPSLPPVQDSLGRLADVHAIEEAQADTAAWAALSKECALLSTQRCISILREQCLPFTFIAVTCDFALCATRVADCQSWAEVPSSEVLTVVHPIWAGTRRQRSGMRRGSGGLPVLT